VSQIYSRRAFLHTSAAALAAEKQLLPATEPARPSFPAADYHVHLSPDLSIEQAVQLGKERQVQIGVVDHPGPGYKIQVVCQTDRRS
jgi:hypothetical protein